MNKIFNTTFENSLRLLIILNCANKALDSDLLSILDFMSIYNKTLSIGEKDLNGKNSFAFCEYTSRRKIIKNAIIELVLKELIEVIQMAKGFCYKINKQGKKIVNSFNTSYAKEYAESIECTLNFSKGKNIKTLLAYINEKANKSGGRNE